VSAGTIGAEKDFALSGQQFTAVQYNVGAPGTAALTGTTLTSSAGTVFLDNDRVYALVGASMTASDGIAFASPLAFVSGQELAVGQEGIGPREVALSGEASTFVTGEVFAPIVRITQLLPPTRFNRPHGHIRLIVEDETVETTPDELSQAIDKIARKAVVKAPTGETPTIKIEGDVTREEKRDIRKVFRAEFNRDQAILAAKEKLRADQERTDEEELMWLI
jgi:hypothetical protein